MEHPVILIHGAFAGPWCMDNLAGYFRGRGWTCHVPALRHHGDDPKTAPDPALATASIDDYTADLADFIEALETPPVILGHAVGGVIAQKLAAMSLAHTLVLLNPNVPWGVLPSTDDERAVARTLMEAGAFWNKPMPVEFDLIAPHALNKLDPDAQRALFERLRPESGRVMFEIFFWMFDDRRAVHVDFADVKCPVLIVSGAEDRTVSPITGRKIAEHYGSRATYYEAPGHAHFMILEPGWEDIAEYCADWMAEAVRLTD